MILFKPTKFIDLKARRVAGPYFGGVIFWIQTLHFSSEGFLLFYNIFTARVRSTREGTVFTGLDGGGGGYAISGLGWGVPHPGLDGGGYPIPGVGENPIQVWMVGGYPIPGGYPSQVWMVRGSQGTPQLGLDGGGYPGYPPPSRPGQGTPLGWGTPHHQDLARVPPPWDGVPPTIKTWPGYPHPGMGYPPDLGWGTPHPLTIKTWLGYPPHPGMGYPPPSRLGQGSPPTPHPRPGMGYPPDLGWVPPTIKTWLGYPPHLGMGYSHPHPRPEMMGYPPDLLDRAALRALATRHLVCLLRSRRRTFLFLIFLPHSSGMPSEQKNIAFS